MEERLKLLDSWIEGANSDLERFQRAVSSDDPFLKAFESMDGVVRAAARKHVAEQARKSILRAREEGEKDDDILSRLQDWYKREVFDGARFPQRTTSSTGYFSSVCLLETQAAIIDPMSGPLG